MRNTRSLRALLHPGREALLRAGIATACLLAALVALSGCTSCEPSECYRRCRAMCFADGWTTMRGDCVCHAQSVLADCEAAR